MERLKSLLAILIKLNTNKMKLKKRSELKTESPIEKLVVDELIKLGFNPTTQFKIGNYRVDIAFPERLIAVECDGKDWHTSEQQISNDKIRDEYIESLGWTVIRVTGRDIYWNTTRIAEAVGYGHKPRLERKSNLITIDYANDDYLTIKDKLEENKITLQEEELKQRYFQSVNSLLDKWFKN